jgi:DamX protein
MQHHFDSLQHSAQQAVLLIDNAEHLPVTALKHVLQMAALTSSNNKPLLRVILLGNNALHDNLDDPLLASFDHLIRRRVELLPFDQEQTAHYILHRLSAANFSANKPFTDAVLHKIHKQSSGWPARINQLAHNVLIETLPTLGTIQGKSSNVKVLRMLGALSGIALVGALIIFQDEFNAWLKPIAQTEQPRTASSPAVTAPSAQIDAAPAPAAKPPATDLAAVTLPLEIPALETQQEKAHEPAAQIAAKQITEPAAPAISEPITETHTAPTTAKAPEPKSAPAETSKPAGDKTTRTDKPAQVVANTAKAKPTKKTITKKPLNKAPAIPVDLPGFRTAWINAQNPSHYTLQLVAGNSLKTLRSFIRRHKPAEPLAVYSTTRKGKPWFGLVQQSYASKQAAIDARSKLPEKLRRQKPWVRTFASLQKDLQQAPE